VSPTLSFEPGLLANLREADLSGANLTGADLREADFLTATQDDIECAESSENEADSRANIAEAILNAERLVAQLKKLQSAL
jgi:uncharacterized protein YjbI with pentapeptide repeats